MTPKGHAPNRSSDRSACKPPVMTGALRRRELPVLLRARCMPSRCQGNTPDPTRWRTTYLLTGDRQPKTMSLVGGSPREPCAWSSCIRMRFPASTLLARSWKSDPCRNRQRQPPTKDHEGVVLLSPPSRRVQGVETAHPGGGFWSAVVLHSSSPVSVSPPRSRPLLSWSNAPQPRLHSRRNAHSKHLWHWPHHGQGRHSPRRILPFPPIGSGLMIPQDK